MITHGTPYDQAAEAALDALQEFPLPPESWADLPHDDLKKVVENILQWWAHAVDDGSPLEPYLPPHPSSNAT